MPLKTRIILLFGLIFSLFACKSKRFSTNIEDPFKYRFMVIPDHSCKINLDTGIDSEIGIIACENIMLEYSYGPYGNPGPQSPEETFYAAYQGFHYKKVMDYFGMDPKVHKIFKDSVDFGMVRPIADEEELMFNCDPCTDVIELSFRGKKTFYPLANIQRPENLIDYSISSKGIRKVFIDADSIYHVYLSQQLLNRNLDPFISLKVKSSNLDSIDLIELLNGIEINN